MDVSAFWPTFWRNRMAVLGALLLLVVVVMALFAHWLAPFDPDASVRVTIDNIYAPPNATHWLGTDDAGKVAIRRYHEPPAAQGATQAA